MTSLYEQVGGQPFFDSLVERFYEGVGDDAVLRPMYPDDLTEPKRHLALFLAQYWGGPGTYSDERGHPRLRMRHAPFVVDEAASEAWLTHMAAAVRAASLPDELESALLDYFTNAAAFLINSA
jgi:hemoglobin